MSEPVATIVRLVRAGTLLTLLIACSLSSSSQDPETAGTQPENIEPDGSAEIDFSGPVWFDENEGVLVLADEEEPCRSPLTEIALPDKLSESLASPYNPAWQDAFSPDWQYAVSEFLSTTRVWELDTTAMAYTESYTLEPDEDSHEQGSRHYHYPKFAPDGEMLWFAGIFPGDGSPLRYIPYADHTPGDDVQDGGELWSPDEPWTVDDSGTALTKSENVETEKVEVDGTVMEFEYWVNDAGEIVSSDEDSRPLVWFPDAHDDFGYPIAYRAIHQVSPTEFIMRPASNYSSDLQEILDSYGEIAHATIDPDQGTFELEQRVPADAESRRASWTLMHPDGTTVYLGFIEGEVWEDEWVTYPVSLAPEDDEEPQDLGPEIPCLAGKDVSWS